MSTTTWCNIIEKLQLLFEIEHFEFFLRYPFVKEILCKLIVWGEMRLFEDKLDFFQKYVYPIKKTFFPKIFFLVVSRDQPYLDLKFERKRMSFSSPTRPLAEYANNKICQLRIHASLNLIISVFLFWFSLNIRKKLSYPDFGQKHLLPILFLVILFF